MATCLNFWDEVWWFLSLKLLGLLSSSLLLFPQLGFVQQDTWRNGYRCWFIWRLQVQSWLLVSNNTGILNTCTRLWLTESEQATPMDSIKDVVRSSVKVPEFDKHLKKAGGHISRNVVEITIEMKTIVWKPLMIEWLYDLSLYIYIYLFAPVIVFY